MLICCAPATAGASGRGDEFGSAAGLQRESARYIAGRLIHASTTIIFHGRTPVPDWCQCGITLIDETNYQASEMSQASIACYASKNSGRMVTVYEPQQERDPHTRSMMSLDEQWHMIKR